MVGEVGLCFISKIGHGLSHFIIFSEKKPFFAILSPNPLSLWKILQPKQRATQGSLRFV